MGDKYREPNILPYIGKAHKYGDFDCISLIQQFYQNELGSTIVLPSYPLNRRWLKTFSSTHIESLITTYAKKVQLTDANNYDLLVFADKNIINHFALYIKPNKMLHVEVCSLSRIDILSSYWVNRLYGVYRLHSVVQ